ncbi:hypothetical protein VNO77_34737 [Canavalia gladiata]|uniref:Uncharacterized protein n=1 Tax=Canavalia gladiata TaxID=3824 RepID=A0AAN9KFG8_CANGL
MAQLDDQFCETPGSNAVGPIDMWEDARPLAWPIGGADQASFLLFISVTWTHVHTGSAHACDSSANFMVHHHPYNLLDIGKNQHKTCSQRHVSSLAGPSMLTHNPRLLHHSSCRHEHRHSSTKGCLCLLVGFNNGISTILCGRIKGAKLVPTLVSSHSLI